MSRFAIKFRSALFSLCGAVLLVASSVLLAQPTLPDAVPKYRTFSQQDLGEKKAKAGKIIAARAWFRFTNILGQDMPSLHVKFNAPVIAMEDSGGLLLSIAGNGKLVDGFGTIAPGQVVTLSGLFAKSNSNVRAEWFWGDGTLLQTQASQAAAAIPVIQQPNGGNVYYYLYKNVIRKPDGIVIGVPNSTAADGWIRYKSADRKFFPHTGAPRCFDYITNPGGRTRDFVKELKNPHVMKYDNHLLGELHSLRLAIMANDRGVTLPDTPATRLGDIVYNDSTNPGDMCNGKTIRQISWMADTALTYCARHDSAGSDFYEQLDIAISRINQAFNGPYHAISFDPFILDGTRTIADVPFLHENPAVQPVLIPYQRASIVEDLPAQFALEQNYPNPFNPSTTIEFTLPLQSIVTLKVYSILGQEVATLFDNEPLDEGEQSIEFNPVNLTSGVYFYRVVAQAVDDETQQYTSIKRMVLLK
jgi:hypothetical protein